MALQSSSLRLAYLEVKEHTTTGFVKKLNEDRDAGRLTPAECMHFSQDAIDEYEQAVANLLH